MTRHRESNFNNDDTPRAFYNFTSFTFFGSLTMRHLFGRKVVGTVAVILGLAMMSQLDAGEISGDDFKVLIEQDTKLINKAIDSVEKAKDKKVAEQRASSGIRSSALMVAAYSNARISGKSAADDGKMAAVRDAALKIAKAAGDKDFKTVTATSKELASAKGTEGKKMTYDELLKAAGKEVSIDDVMHNFKKTNAHGGAWEDAIKNNSKKAVSKADDTTSIAHRVIALGEYSKIVTKASNDKEKKEWNEFNEKMIKAGEELLAAGKAKKTGADLAKAFTAVNGSCTACHNTFK